MKKILWTLLYFILEFLGIGLFVMLGVKGIYGTKGFLISLVAIALMTYSTYNLFEKNMTFRAFILGITELISGPHNGFIERDEKLNAKK